MHDGRKGVIGKCCGASFLVFFQHLSLDLINRYCMIWQDVMDNNHDDWIDYLFLYRNM
jgi:hypothetical protein